MVNFFKVFQPKQKKSHALQQNIISNIILQSNFNQRFLSPEKAIFYYDIAAPVSTAIDRVNDEFKVLEMVLETKENGDITIETDDPILDFMKQPNDDMTQEGFLDALGAYFLITGEVYVIATGTNLNSPPGELIIVSPSNITVKKADDGFIGEISVNTLRGTQETYKRTESGFRFFNKDQSREIWQIKNFSALQDGRGNSNLNSVSDEIDQYILTATHNLGLLRNGVRSSGAFTTDDALSTDQFDRLKEQSDNFCAGPENAGKSMILEGGMKFMEMSISPKDMDFENLTKRAMAAVFNRYKVPLPLVSADNMTLSNMDSARLILYDNAVLPLAKMLFAELTIFLRPRFGLSEKTQLVPFVDNIPALRLRRNEELKFRRELGLETINEGRAQLGRDDIVEGGDEVFIPNNLVPAGSTPVNTTDTVVVEDENKSSREDFITIMKGQIDVKGNRTFTDIEIGQYADEQGLI